MSKIADHLEDAAWYLEDHGWCQLHMRRGEARCMVGALAEVILSDDPAVAEERELMEAQDALARHLGFGERTRNTKPWIDCHRTATHITWWNDAEGRRFEEVYAALMGTAETLRRGEAE